MISRRLFSFILIGILAGASACRIGPTFGPPPPPGPAPVISSISPMSAAAGGAAGHLFHLTDERSRRRRSIHAHGERQPFPLRRRPCLA